MARQCTVAEARTQLPTLLRLVERGESVRITRRGKPIAVLVSDADYQRLAAPSGGLAADYQKWRTVWTAEDTDISEEFFEDLRDRSPGRDVAI